VAMITVTRGDDIQQPKTLVFPDTEDAGTPMFR
jgi:hypothetical protein